ncbi:E3 ubiquitin-protein ligase TTC3 [Frankliniella fusca]|uniref:E3 ubiquitin-protein ligase TTC3 n=1 Tax=Frankliniella fusca TaxID=407009 RepID=A0AAE1LKL1_9NEOP|nr:E3 ubiquitin-protein ligase TTC3 [Frankliniella fusca]
MGQTADQCKVLGNKCMKNQDFTGAVKNYTIGINLDPENPILYCNMAQAYLNMKDYVEAEKNAKKAILYRSDYVKAYYRAAKGALGRHSVYDSMMCLAQGVQNCLSQDVEELFLMAKELSPEFENALRSFRDKEKAQANKKKGNSSSALDHNTLKEEEASCAANVKLSKKVSKSHKTQIESTKLKEKAGEEEQDTLKAEDGDMPDKMKELEEEEKQLKLKLKEIEIMKKKELQNEDQKVKELERKEKERNEQELKEKEKERMAEEHRKMKELEQSEKEKKEQELKEREEERIAEERREQQRKDLERKAKEIEELERKERQAKAKQLKAQEKMDQLKEREKRAREEKASDELRLAKEKGKELDRMKNQLHSQMKEGSLALMKGLHRKAIDSFCKAVDTINTNSKLETLGVGDPKDIIVLYFALSQARIYSNEYADIVKAIHQLDKMVKDKLHIELPAIFLLLGSAFIRLNRFSKAVEPLKRGISYLSKDKLFPIFTWPGTNDVIPFTERNQLKDALANSMKTCKQYHKPDAVCFYENCLHHNQHILPSRNIFFSDPDFVGFIHIVCQENCHVHFHVTCWKEFKENMSEVQKLTEKDFLGKNCLTPDCMVQCKKPAIIIKVIVIGPDGEEKSSCECTPPPPLPSVIVKEKAHVEKSPKKKQRKRQAVTVNLSKRVRKDSKSQSVVENSTPQENGLQYKNALAKLVAARQSNFGYGDDSPDPHKAHSLPLSPKLGKDEEFVYSYFLEIFKKEGYMSIYKLQEHWETNKELLPVLKPALITHTDLVKFLLDTDGFAVVQDMIGITSQLPNISAIVEAKAEAPQPIVYGWTPSAATVLETSKTLSLTSFTNEIVSTQGNVSGKSEVFASNLSDELGHLRLCKGKAISSGRDVEVYPDVKSNASCSSEENSTNGIIEESSSNPLNSGSCSSNSNIASLQVEESVLIAHNDSNIVKEQNKNINVQAMKSYNECSGLSKQARFKHDSNSNNENDADFPRSSVSPLDAQSTQNHYEANSDVDSETSKQSSLEPVHSNNNINGKQSMVESRDTESSTGVNKTLQTDVKSQPRTTWKPRAKLLEWASETFPDYSKSRLWQALTLVRAQNNFTLSGLSFTAIEERVRVVLEQNDDF